MEALLIAMPPAPPAKTRLARYRLLAPTANIRVSPLCLGGMSFGDAWSGFMASVDQKNTEDILDYFYSQGGNFIDTANNYQHGQSESWIGEWMQKRGIRDQIVLATKYAVNSHAGRGDSENIVNYQGTGPKSLLLSVNQSLKRLQTEYIDLLYVHWYDPAASVPELMQSLNSLVTSGKVLCLGTSSMPAWFVAKANQYARDHGLAQFSIFQAKWSAAAREIERDIVPMCRAEGMALVPFSAMGSGAFKTEAQLQKTLEDRSTRVVLPSEADRKVSRVLEGIAERKGSTITSVALAYVLHKSPYVFPIVGCRSVQQLKGNIEALGVELSGEDLQEIEGAVPFDPAYPMNIVYGPMIPYDLQKAAPFYMGGTVDHVGDPKPISPAEA